MRVVGLLAVRDEERFIGACLENLAAQGVSAYVVDNESSDRTVEIAERYIDRGVIGIESLPWGGAYDLRAQLERKQELAASLDADWLIHLDADEIRLPPAGEASLVDALGAVERAGFNAVNFLEFTFIPTREAPDHDHPDFQRTMRFYYPFQRRFPHQLKAWRRQPEPVDLASSGGHKVAFPGLRMCPWPFRMRHYLFLSRAHAVRKFVRRPYMPQAVEGGWHGWRAALRPEHVELPRQSELRRYVSDGELDFRDNWTRHWLDMKVAAAGG